MYVYDEQMNRYLGVSRCVTMYVFVCIQELTNIKRDIWVISTYVLLHSIPFYKFWNLRRKNASLYIQSLLIISGSSILFIAERSVIPYPVETKTMRQAITS